MNYIKSSVIAFLVVTGLSWWGCASSSGSSGEKQDQSTSQSAGKPAAGGTVTDANGRKADTLDVTSQNAQRPPYQTPPQSAAGGFAVQVGAYKLQENADRVASLARERFGMNVVTVLDKVKSLYKVMVGNFITRDEARTFRDEMYQKFPSDYKDAWVSELSQK
jgi:cell division septation protein DedD